MQRVGLTWEPRRRPEWLKITEERWQQVFGDSTPEDAFRAAGDDPQEPDSDERRRDSLERMAKGLTRSWYTSPRVRRAIAETAATTDTAIDATKAAAAAVGLCMAMGRYNDPQRIRFGNKYVVLPPELSPVEVRPVTELAFSAFTRWLKRQSIAEAEAHLLGEPARGPLSDPAPDTVPIEDALFLEDVAGGLLDEILFTSMDLDSLLAAADLTLAERELVEAFRYTGEWPEAARMLDLSLPAMRQRKRRLLAKLAPG